MQRLRLLANDRRHRFGRRAARERPAARRHLVEDRSQRELIGAKVDRPAGRLLRGHVCDGAQHDAGPRRFAGRRKLRDVGPRGLRELGEAEVENLDEALPRDHQVLGLQVAVHDPGLVRPGEPLGDLAGEGEKTLGRKCAVREKIAQRFSLHELHRDVGDRVGLADLVDRDDVGMIERGGRAGLLLEAREPVPILGNFSRQDLDRDFPSKPGVPGLPDLPHASGAKRRENFVRTEAASGCHGQAGMRIQPCARASPVRDACRQRGSNGRHYMSKNGGRLHCHDSENRSRWLSREECNLLKVKPR